MNDAFGTQVRVATITNYELELVGERAIVLGASAASKWLSLQGEVLDLLRMLFFAQSQIDLFLLKGNHIFKLDLVVFEAQEYCKFGHNPVRRSLQFIEKVIENLDILEFVAGRFIAVREDQLELTNNEGVLYFEDDHHIVERSGQSVLYLNDLDDSHFLQLLQVAVYLQYLVLVAGHHSSH